MTEPDAVSVDENLLRDLAPQVLGAVVRRFRDFTAAEDAVQEALLAASQQWPRYGVPDNPRGWLIAVAGRRATDRIRAETARRGREQVVAGPPIEEPLAGPGDAADAIHQDDTLILLFMCCHPALTPASAIALTLRAVGGLTTAEIARAFLVPESTMAQRISRAKQTIKTSGIPFATPTPDEQAGRLRALLHIVYLIFNEGYTTSSGDTLHRTDLSNEAIRLARLVHGMLPDSGEAAGLLALLLLTDARRPARTGPDGELIPLDKQDRSLWNRAAIAEGTALLSAALPRGAVGQYQLQAAVAAVHDEAPSAAATDWPQILALYGLLEQMDANPIVSLNRTIALAMVQGPRPGLEQLDALERDGRLAGHYRLDAVRAHLLEMAGDRDAAVACYLKAAGKTASVPERHYLTTQAASLNATARDRTSHET